MSKARAYYAPRDENSEEAPRQHVYKAAQKPKREKKGFFRRPLVAIIIAAIMVLASTAAGVERSIDDLCWEVESIYYGGVYNEDYDAYDPALYDQLEMRYFSASGMLTAVKGYEGIEQEVKDFEAAIDTFYDAWTPHAECHTNSLLQESYKALDLALDDVELSERDQTLYDTYESDFLGSQRLIEQVTDDYNDAVRDLQRRLGTFPTNLLVEFSDVDVPQLYE